MVVQPQRSPSPTASNPKPTKSVKPTSSPKHIVPEDLTVGEPVRLGEQLTDPDKLGVADRNTVVYSYADVVETLEKTQGGLAQCEI